MTSSVPPLDGTTVLDFSHALAGPYCTMLMAAYGAKVIKIESPDGGDIGRKWGPPFQGDDAAYFVGLNSGKQSVAIDLKTAEGLQTCRDPCQPEAGGQEPLFPRERPFEIPLECSAIRPGPGRIRLSRCGYRLLRPRGQAGI